MLKRVLMLAAAGLAFAGAAHAVIPSGVAAPDFTAPAFLAGQPFTFSLADALKKGPVVLYFFPAAHTAGCNIEAHLFADATDKFKAAGATVIGVTAGNVDQLSDFSKETEHCAGKFPVAADTTLSIAKSYDAISPGRADRTSRTSFVITPDHKVAFAMSVGKPDLHIDDTLAVVEGLKH
jgi:peroxiredoxin